MEPFLKWAGGKRWLAKRQIISAEPSMRWVEPFAGSAAMFFNLEPRVAMLSDSNWDLINTYIAVRDQLDEFLENLETLKPRTTKAEYYAIRGDVPKCDIKRAARFVYLNRLAWNGLYRVNKRGEFNVPRGTKSSVTLPTDDWHSASDLLQRAQLRHCDFERVIEECGEGDSLFVDPPYTVAHNNNGFVKYNEKIFSWNDQIRLKKALDSAISRGAKVVVTNADHMSVRELYSGNEMQNLSRASVIAGRAAARGNTQEALIVMTPLTIPDQVFGR